MNPWLGRAHTGPCRETLCSSYRARFSACSIAEHKALEYIIFSSRGRRLCRGPHREILGSGCGLVVGEGICCLGTRGREARPRRRRGGWRSTGRDLVHAAKLLTVPPPPFPPSLLPKAEMLCNSRGPPQPRGVRESSRHLLGWHIMEVSRPGCLLFADTRRTGPAGVGCALCHTAWTVSAATCPPPPTPSPPTPCPAGLRGPVTSGEGGRGVMTGALLRHITYGLDAATGGPLTSNPSPPPLPPPPLLRPGPAGG